MEEEYYVVDPKEPIAGCLAVVVSKSKYELLGEIEKRRTKHRFIARAYPSDHIPLHGSISEIMRRTQFHSISIKENPLPIYLHHGGKNAIYFDLYATGKDGHLSYVEVEIEAELPSKVFMPARTAINELMDSIQRQISFPLTIVRIDLLLKGEIDALAHQIILPYTSSMEIGPIGGIHQYPIFSSYESVLREAMISSSPYYRLLCAYRLYEGLNKLKSWLKNKSEEFGIEEKIPKDPIVDKDLLVGVGLNIKYFDSVVNANDLWRKFTDLRNQVAHYFTKGKDYPLHLSHGHTYSEYSLASAILLHYSNITFKNLVIFFNKNLSGKLAAGSILPMREYRDKFIIRV